MRQHRLLVYRKLQVRARTAAVRRAEELHLVDLEAAPEASAPTPDQEA